MQEIICVLDKSGSMQSCRDDAVSGFNAFLKDQQAVDTPANLTIVWFDSIPHVGYEGPLAEAGSLMLWPPGGSTALYDAIGRTFAHVKQRFTEEKPEKVILAILTDGLENTSRDYSQQAVADLIKEHQDKYGWEVIFLAADQDAWATASGLNISQQNSYTYDSNNTAGGFATYSAAVTRARVS